MTDLPQSIARLRELISSKIVNYDSQMEGADHDDFIRVEFASGAMRQLLSEFDALESRAPAPVVVVDEAAIATALRSAVSIIEDLYSCEPIEAQHDETGYIWSGPRKQTPPRYTEFSNAAGVPPEEMARILSEFKSALGQGDAQAKETK